MKFVVPQGCSRICHFSVQPQPPANGKAQPWPVLLTSEGAPQEVDRFDISFKLDSTTEQRQVERMILVFCIDEAVQTAQYSWRFLQSGVMYCENEGDRLDRIQTTLSDDNKVVTATVKCLSDANETFNFSFVAIRKDNASGECQIFASEDPGGSSNREP